MCFMRKGRQGRVRGNDRAVGGRNRGGRVVFWVEWERVPPWARWPRKAALRRI